MRPALVMMLAAMTPPGTAPIAKSEDEIRREVELARDAAKVVVKRAFGIELTAVENAIDFNELPPAVCALAFGLAFNSFAELYGISDANRHELISAAAKVVRS